MDAGNRILSRHELEYSMIGDGNYIVNQLEQVKGNSTVKSGSRTDLQDKRTHNSLAKRSRKTQSTYNSNNVGQMCKISKTN